MGYLLEPWDEQEEHDEKHERALVEALEGCIEALGYETKEDLEYNVHVYTQRKEQSPFNLAILTVNFMFSLERQLRLFVLMNLIRSPFSSLYMNLGSPWRTMALSRNTKLCTPTVWVV